MTTFVPWRSAYSVVVAKAASRWGWPICTAMNSRPAAMAARAAARVSVVVVTVMLGLLGSVSPNVGSRGVSRRHPTM
jgi:hypothetical protein